MTSANIKLTPMPRIDPSHRLGAVGPVVASSALDGADLTNVIVLSRRPGRGAGEVLQPRCTRAAVLNGKLVAQLVTGVALIPDFAHSSREIRVILPGLVPHDPVVALVTPYVAIWHALELTPKMGQDLQRANRLRGLSSGQGWTKAQAREWWEAHAAPSAAVG